MDPKDVEKIWQDVVSEASDRSKGSFKRALWYGYNSKRMGQNKGLRKGIRNAPKKIALGALDFAPLAPGLSSLIGNCADTALSLGKEIYSSEIKPKILSKPASTQEKLRKKIKDDVKKMKGNAFEVIDRNLVKLKDASKKVSPAVKDLMDAAPDMQYTQSSAGVGMGRSPNPEKQAEKAHGLLFTIAETEYYVDKEICLVRSLKDALDALEKDLNKMQGMVQTSRKEAMDYIATALD